MLLVSANLAITLGFNLKMHWVSVLGVKSMATKKVFQKAVRVLETPITDKISMVLFESGSIQLRYTKGGIASCMLNDEMVEAILTAKFRVQLDTFRVQAMDLRAAKGHRNPKVVATPIQTPVDIAAIVAQAVAAAMASIAQPARKTKTVALAQA